MDGSGFGRGLEKSFVVVRVLGLGLFGRWQMYCLFTIGKRIVCVRAAVFWCVCWYCFGVLR